MTRGLCRLIVQAGLALGGSTTVAAQVIQAPPRQAQLQAPQSRATSDLTVAVHFLTGYDRAPNPLGTPQLPLLATPRPGGFLWLLDSSLGFSRSSERRSFNASGRGYLNSYQYSGSRAMYGGDVAVGGDSSLGRKDSMNLSLSYQDTPYYAVGLLGPIGGVGGNPTLGFSNGRTRRIDGAAGWDREWTRAFSTNASYSYGRFGYNTTAVSGTYVNESQNARVDFTRSIDRRLRAVGSIGRSVVSNRQGVVYRPTAHDSVDGGISYSRSVSATKAFTISVRGGASHVRSNNYVSHATYEYWTPLFSASGSFDLGRSWNVNGTYRRTVVVPNALNAAQSAFATHTVDAGVGGMLSNRIQLAGLTLFASGLNYSAALAGGGATYRSYMFTGQMQYRLTETLSAMVNVAHVESRMNGAASVGVGVVPHLRRSQLRGGVSWELPVVGPRARRN